MVILADKGDCLITAEGRADAPHQGWKVAKRAEGVVA